MARSSIVRFRELVETYFEWVEYTADDVLDDRDAMRAARSKINQMLPRVIQVVDAADLAGPNTPDRGPMVADVKVLQNIFSARYAEGADQKILDVIDMAVGVYEASRLNALARTVNPFHYVMRMLSWVAGLPRRALTSVGLLPLRAPRVRADDVARLEAVASRLASAGELIESRFADLQKRQSRHFSEHAGLLADLAQRLDFMERVLAQQRPANRLKPSDRGDVVTPV